MKFIVVLALSFVTSFAAMADTCKIAGKNPRTDNYDRNPLNINRAFQNSEKLHVIIINQNGTFTEARSKNELTISHQFLGEKIIIMSKGENNLVNIANAIVEQDENGEAIINSKQISAAPLQSFVIHLNVADNYMAVCSK